MKNPLYSAILKSLSGRVSTYIIQFVALTIYARIFSPEEFGIIASIQVFVVFFMMLSDIGIGPAIISKKKFESFERDGVYTFTLIMGLFLGVVFYAFSYFLNDFYGGYQYQDIAKLVCIAIVFSSLNIVPTAAMNKDTKFIHIAVIEIVGEIISLVFIYILYSYNYGVLALASRPLIQSATRLVFLYIFSDRTSLGRPAFSRGVHHVRSILNFSLFQFGFNFINYFSRNLDNILVAKYFGMAVVGAYDKAYQLMRYPLMVTTFAMTPAIQPILTKERENIPKVVFEHNKLTARLFSISIPISFFIYLNSHEIIIFLFGYGWQQVEPLLKIFSFMIPIQSVLSTSGAFFQVMNRPKLLFFSGLISALSNLSAIINGVYLGGVEYIAIGLVFSFSFNFIISYMILFKYCFEKPIKSFYLNLFNSIVYMLPSVSIYYFISRFYLGLEFQWPIAKLSLNIIAGIFSLLLFKKLIIKSLKYQ